MRGVIALAVLLLVGGCAERWAKPGAGEPEFRAMQAQCEAHAFERWPPRLREELVFPGQWVPPVRSCDGRGRCHWFGGYYDPPRTAVVDDHDRPRRQERRACFVGNGWTPVED